MRRDLEKRAARLESSARAGEPSKVLSGSPMNEAEAQDALPNWRACGTVRNGVLVIGIESMSCGEWEAL